MRHLALLVAVGCTGEPGTGTGAPDPSADTDGDGLLDRDEEAMGLDPRNVDTDGDTYRDPDEITEGTDPLDPKSRIYRGYWPYNPNKDALVDAGFTGAPIEVGDRFGRVPGSRDRFDQEVDLFDFAGTDTLTVIDASASWCEPCQAASSWLAGGADPYDWEVLYAAVRAGVDAGEVHWITFLTDDGGPDAPDVESVREWDDLFAHEHVAVLTDPDRHVLGALNAGETYYGDPYAYFPGFAVIDGDLNVVARGFLWDALDYVLYHPRP